MSDEWQAQFALTARVDALYGQRVITGAQADKLFEWPSHMSLKDFTEAAHSQLDELLIRKKFQNDLEDLLNE